MDLPLLTHPSQRVWNLISDISPCLQDVSSPKGLRLLHKRFWWVQWQCNRNNCALEIVQSARDNYGEDLNFRLGHLKLQ